MELSSQISPVAVEHGFDTYGSVAPPYAEAAPDDQPVTSSLGGFGIRIGRNRRGFGYRFLAIHRVSVLVYSCAGLRLITRCQARTLFLERRQASRLFRLSITQVGARRIHHLLGFLLLSGKFGKLCIVV